MPYIGSRPPPSALTSSDIADSIITEAKMGDDAFSLAELKAGTDGQIISWVASGNPVAIAVGTSGHFLKSQGAGSQPVFAAAGGGKIGQVVHTSYTTEGTGTNTSWADVSGFSATLTPSATSSKILCRAMSNAGSSTISMSLNLKMTYNHSGISATDVQVGTSLSPGTQTHWGSGEQFGTAGSTTNMMRTICMEGLISPSTTNAVTVQVQIIQPDSGVSYTWFLNRSHTRGGGVQDSNAASSLVLMEILA